MNPKPLKGVPAGGRGARRRSAPRPRCAQDVSACLITKTDTNPFFVKMREGAQAKADELGVKLTALAGRDDGDNEGQVAAMESCIADGVDGHPARAVRQRGDRRHRQAGARRRHPRDRARHAARPDRRRRRDLRHRQLQGRRADRRLGEGAARRRGGRRQDRLPRPQPGPADRRRAARPGLHAGLRHRPRRSRRRSATRPTRASSATT